MMVDGGCGVPIFTKIPLHHTGDDVDKSITQNSFLFDSSDSMHHHHVF